MPAFIGLLLPAPSILGLGLSLPVPYYIILIVIIIKKKYINNNNNNNNNDLLTDPTIVALLC